MRDLSVKLQHPYDLLQILNYFPKEKGVDWVYGSMNRVQGHSAPGYVASLNGSRRIHDQGPRFKTRRGISRCNLSCSLRNRRSRFNLK
jgi:hypothetical protein